MKKFVLFISLFALSVLSVQARENKLYFTEENNRLYYESKLIDEDIFMKHIDMKSSMREKLQALTIPSKE